MKKDFLKNFENFSNIELLKMLIKPENYEVEAINAANKILSERSVTESEKQEVELHFHNLKAQETKKNEKTKTYKNTIFELFQPIISHGEDSTPSKWLNSFLVLIVIQFIWYLIEAITSFFTINDSFTNIFNSLILLYIMIVFYLLLKKNKWGWILLFAEKLFTVLISLFFLVIFMGESYFSEFNLKEFIWPLIIGLFFLVFLWRQEIVAFFNITDTEKIKFAKRITYVVIFFGVLFVSIAYNA
jgi:hypothetical protein